MVQLLSCDNRLKKIIWAVADEMEIYVICGHRGREGQEKAFNEGKSKLQFPESKHNFIPSRAVDLAPRSPKGGIDWSDHAAFDRLAEVFMRKAEALGIPVRWGGDFLTLVDRPHFELTENKAPSD